MMPKLKYCAATRQVGRAPQEHKANTLENDAQTRTLSSVTHTHEYLGEAAESQQVQIRGVPRQGLPQNTVRVARHALGAVSLLLPPKGLEGRGEIWGLRLKTSIV